MEYYEIEHEKDIQDWITLTRGFMTTWKYMFNMRYGNAQKQAKASELRNQAWLEMKANSSDKPR
jgi:hypothetical protein